MPFNLLDTGFILRTPETGPEAVAAGPRCALTADGRLVCSFILQSKLGVNDFVPTLAVSVDGGAHWTVQGPVWPHLRERFSMFCSISASPSGDLYLYGSMTPIDSPGESFWLDATQGLKANRLFWARSRDGGRNWTEPQPFDLPLAGAGECPGPLCVTSSGRWLACYSPYNTFDPALQVKRNQVVVMRSDDGGGAWQHTSMLSFAEPLSGGAEAWVVQLAGGHLLGVCWQTNLAGGDDYPNPYALSTDEGETWSPTLYTGIRGQSTALTPLPDGRALLAYNQRKHGERGVWLATARPSTTDFGLESNQIVWRAEQPTQGGVNVDHTAWQDFAFGEPSVTLLPDGTLLLALWCLQPSARGICYVRLRAT